MTAHWGSRIATLVVTGVAVMAGCTDDDPVPPKPDPTSAQSRACEEPGQLPVVLQVALEPVRPGGPNLDRLLRVTRTASGSRCLDIAVDHADPGADAVSWEVEAGQGGETWRLEGTSAEDEPTALWMDAPGCLVVSGSLVVVGAGQVEFDYEAEGRVGRGCRTG